MASQGPAEICRLLVKYIEQRTKPKSSAAVVCSKMEVVARVMSWKRNAAVV